MFFRRLARLIHPHNFFLPEEISARPPVQEKLRLSDAILRGCGMVEETRRSYHGCAIGTGYMYKTRRSLALSELGNAHRIVAREFGIPTQVVSRASCLHFNGMSRVGVAIWLHSKGY